MRRSSIDRVVIATPAPPRSRNGNRITAQRWRRLLTELGHRVRICGPESAGDGDLLIAIHARKSHGAVVDFAARRPGRPIVVVISGTDLHSDLHGGAGVRARMLESLDRATAIVALHPLVGSELDPAHRRKLEVILQSAEPLGHPPARSRRTVRLVVVGHLRPVKDPFLPARALRELPARSRLRLRHFGRAMEPAMLEEARRSMEADARYQWVGERSRGEVRQAVAGAHALVHPSIAEGGANTVSEAFVLGTPVLASAIPGNLGLLGADYPGVFPVGDAGALSALLQRFELEPEFRATLGERCTALAARHAPERERTAWQELIRKLG